MRVTCEYFLHPFKWFCLPIILSKWLQCESVRVYLKLTYTFDFIIQLLCATMKKKSNAEFNNPNKIMCDFYSSNNSLKWCNNCIIQLSIIKQYMQYYYTHIIAF